MQRLMMMSGLVGVMALGLLAAPGTASATCSDRKATGTILGGIGGALIGNSISHGGGGAVLGGLGGAVVGHQIAASGCGRARSTAYYAPRDRSGYAYRRDAPRAVRYLYYDQYGQAISEGPAPGSSYTQAAYRPIEAPVCRTETQSYYDERGSLIQRPVQICDR